MNECSDIHVARGGRSIQRKRYSILMVGYQKQKRMHKDTGCLPLCREIVEKTRRYEHA